MPATSIKSRSSSSAVVLGSVTTRALLLFVVLCQIRFDPHFPVPALSFAEAFSSTHLHLHLHLLLRQYHRTQHGITNQIFAPPTASHRLSVSLHDDPDNPTEDLLLAAAELTASTSSLLGIKSVGVDYGLVRTGLAVTVGYEPKPVAILSDLNHTELSHRIVRIAEAEQASRIIVGLPFHKNGTEAEQTVLTRDFANHLNCAVYAHFGPGGMPIYLSDERYTSKEAAARIRSVNPRANTYKELDADAACIILEYYYNDNGLGAQLVELPNDPDIRDAVHRAWLLRKQEKEARHQELTERRMTGAKEAKRAIMERGRLLEEKLAGERSDADNGKKKKKKKKRKKK